MATGGPFYIGIVPTDVMKNAAARAQFAQGEMPTVARVGLAVAVRVGAPRPNISTPEALKQTWLNARAIWRTLTGELAMKSFGESRQGTSH